MVIYSADLPDEIEAAPDPAAMEQAHADITFSLAEAAGYDLIIHTRRPEGSRTAPTRVEETDARRRLHLYLHHLADITPQEQARAVLDVLFDQAHRDHADALTADEHPTAGLQGPVARLVAAGVRISDEAVNLAAVMLTVLTRALLGGGRTSFEARADLALRWGILRERGSNALDVDLTVTRTYSIGILYADLDAHPDTQGWGRWLDGTEDDMTETMRKAVADLAWAELGDLNNTTSLWADERTVTLPHRYLDE